MTAIRWAVPGLCALFFSFGPVSEGYSSVRPAVRVAKAASGSLQSIAAWLEKSGVDGAMGAEVADALNVPRLESEETVGARQMAFQSGETLYLAQVLADERREFLLFMVKRPDRVIFYLSTVADGFKKAVVSIPERHIVIPLHGAEAEKGFRDVVAYWEEIVRAN